MQQPVTFETVSQMIWQHMEARDWHTNPPRGLATSIVLEAAELLEHYQWSDKAAGTREDLAAELADIFIYAFHFAESQEIDIVEAIQLKLQKSAQKYPAEKFKGQKTKDMRKVWLDTKLQYKKTGL
ncbi:MAG TPA: MazG-like family protein [Candidatus Saccharimonadia bacterium]|nr:MazG-like family protein [Candidatus Saccharimonadia bacterium]